MSRQYLSDINKPKSKKGKIIGWGLGVGLPLLAVSAAVVGDGYDVIDHLKGLPSEVTSIFHSDGFNHTYPDEMWEPMRVPCDVNIGLLKNMFSETMVRVPNEKFGDEWKPEYDSVGFWMSEFERMNPKGVDTPDYLEEHGISDDLYCSVKVPKVYKPFYNLE